MSAGEPDDGYCPGHTAEEYAGAVAAWLKLGNLDKARLALALLAWQHPTSSEVAYCELLVQDYERAAALEVDP